MSYTKVYIHFVWSTKNRIPFLNTPGLRLKIWKHIKENCESKSIHVDCINGYEDHCHCLVSMSREQTMASVMHLIKGESSNWINKNKLCPGRFEWQPNYFAISVSQSRVSAVRAYIKNQEEHHCKESFQHEVTSIAEKHGFILNGDI